MNIFRVSFSILIVFSLSVVSLSAQTVYEDYKDGEVFIKIKDDVDIAPHNVYISLDQLAPVVAIKEKYQLRNLVRPFDKIPNTRLERIFVLQFTEIHKVDDILRDLAAHPDVEYVDKSLLYKVLYSPNDPEFTQGKQWHLNKINAPQAWGIGKGDDNQTIVAVIDDGINWNHTDLQDNLYKNLDEIPGNGIDDDGNGYIDDYIGWNATDSLAYTSTAANSYSGHGTHVAGIACADTDNGKGVASIGFNVKLMPIKAGPDFNLNPPSGVVQPFSGLFFATLTGADVINMSFGSTQFTPIFDELAQLAHDSDIVLVAGAGNSNTQDMHYPANSKYVISVAATNENDQRGTIAGGGSTYGTWIDVSAPGLNINSTCSSGGYCESSGTSMAELVAGLVGLMRSINPSMNADQIESCLKSSAHDIEANLSAGEKGRMGAGRIDAFAACQCVSQTGNSIDAGISAVVSPTGTKCDGITNVTPQITLENYGNVALTSVTINYKLDNGSTLTTPWSGNLAGFSNTTVSLPSISFALGGHALEVWTSNPNGTTDDKPTNDKVYSDFTVNAVVGQSLPLVEGFESATYPPAGWAVVNSDNGNTWERTTAVGALGSASVKMNNFSGNLTGQVDELITPSLNLTTMPGSFVYFDYAYAQKGSSSDRLKVFVSIDCGAGWLQRYNKAGSLLATTTAQSGEFIPTANMWKQEAVSLAAFASNDNVLVKFQFTSAEGNHLYIDNVNISTVGIEDPSVFESLSLYPNPSSGIVKVGLDLKSTQDVQLTVYNILGETILQSTNDSFTKGVINFDLSDQVSGMYFVELKTDQGIATRKLKLVH